MRYLHNNGIDVSSINTASNSRPTSAEALQSQRNWELRKAVIADEYAIEKAKLDKALANQANILSSTLAILRA